MSKFNQQTKSATTTTNKAGGDAFIQSKDFELAAILLTSFVDDKYYESQNDLEHRLSKLITECDPKFAAKAAVYARHVAGMRSISHVAASNLVPRLTGTEWGKKFFQAVVRRPDDMTEILAHYFQKNGVEKVKNGRKWMQPIPNSIKKGFREAFNKFDNYQIAKYKMENKAVSLVDLVNILHPKATDKNKESLAKLVKGELTLGGQTRQDSMTSIGQKAKAENLSKEEVEVLKSQKWAELLNSGKYPYFDLLRNLRNILDQADKETIAKACELLVQENVIKKSLVLPFRYQTALHELQKVNTQGVRDVIVALSKALDISLANVPVFDGKTLVVTDTSASMGGYGRDDTDPKVPINIAALFSAIMAKTGDTDLMIFADRGKYKQVNPLDSTLTIADLILKAEGEVGHGTNFHSIFETADKVYDRVVIFSDMQGWMSDRGGYYRDTNPSKSFADYKKRTGANPKVFSFDLNGYGTLQFPENDVFSLAGFSSSVFDVMKKLEGDKKALINEINDYIDF